MLISINRNHVLVAFISLITAVCVCVIGCTNPTAQSKESKNTTNQMSSAMFFMLNTAKHINGSLAFEKLRSLHSSASRNLEEVPTIRFVVENLHNVLDSDIFDVMIAEAEQLFGSDRVSLDPLGLEMRNSFLEHIGERADTNIYGFDLSMLGLLTIPNGMGYSQADLDHVYVLLKMLSNENAPFDKIFSHLESASASTNHTIDYMSIVERATNLVNSVSASGEDLSNETTMRSVATIGILTDINKIDDEITINWIIEAIIVAILTGLVLKMLINGGGKITGPSCNVNPHTGECTTHLDGRCK